MMKKTIVFLSLLILSQEANAQGKISGSLNHAMAICPSDSILWSWGYDHIGQNTPNLYIPNSVWADSTGGQLQKIVSVSTYYTHAAAVLSNGTVRAWGTNTFGQLGDSLTNSNTIYPVQMRGENGYGYLDSIIEVSCGYYHSLMLKSDGTVWSCGYNYYGQLGINSTQSWSFPKPVLGPGATGNLNNIIQIDAGSHSSVALRNDGTVWTWGEGAYGTLGTGNGISYFPVQVPGLPQITKISIKGGHVLALDNNGKIWSWGENSFGQVGNNSFSHVYSPVQVLDQTANNEMDSIVDIGTGMMHSFAIHANGKAYSWGSNNNGQLGDGTTIDRYVPVLIKGPGGTGLLDNIIELEGGHLSSVARKSDGTIYNWGHGYTSYPEIIYGICDVLSHEEMSGFESDQILLFPNPTTSHITVASNGISNINSIRIFDTSGKILQFIEGLQVAQFEIDMSNYPTGVLFVSVETANGSATQKLVIE